jgi:hypothetical protein
MNYYAAIDVSLEALSICVIDANGKIVREGKCGERAGGASRKRPHHPHHARQGLHGLEEVGDAHRQAGRHDQGQGSARPTELAELRLRLRAGQAGICHGHRRSWSIESRVLSHVASSS